MKEHTLPSVSNTGKYSKEIVGIDVMKTFFAICVVAIHTHPYSNYNSTPYSITRFCDILLLCAVPFFFITTGYFMGKKLQSPLSDEKNKKVLEYCLKKYLKLYLIWTAVYLPITLYYYFMISEQSIGMKFLDFLRGLLFLGEHWNSWMLWYLLSMIYALILFNLIWQLKGNYCIIYIISALIFAMSAIFDYYSNTANAGFVIRSIRFLFGENTRLFTSPFYLSIGMIIGRTKKMTFKISLGTGITLIFIGFLVKMSKSNAGGGYSEFSLAMCAAGIFLLAGMSEIKGQKNSVAYKLRAFSSLCYFTHMMVYTLLCIFVWNEFKSGPDVFAMVMVVVSVIYIIWDIICTVKKSQSDTMTCL